jgi:hypothetical protein
MADVNDLVDDIRSALTEEQRADMDDQLAKASDMQARVGVLLNFCWQARGAPVLAQRVKDQIDHG